MIEKTEDTIDYRKELLRLLENTEYYKPYFRIVFIFARKLKTNWNL